MRAAYMPREENVVVVSAHIGKTQRNLVTALDGSLERHYLLYLFFSRNLQTRSWLNLKSPARANPLRSDATHSPQLPSCMPSQREGAKACGPSIVFPRRMQATAGLDWGVCRGLPGTKCARMVGGLPAQVGAVRGSDPCVRLLELQQRCTPAQVGVASPVEWKQRGWTTGLIGRNI